jgi:hypothetical protein
MSDNDFRDFFDDDDNDPFGSDDFDSFDDASFDDDFDFGEEDDLFGGGDDDLFGEDDALDEDFSFDNEEFATTAEDEGGGPSGAFIAIAAILILALLGGFAFIIYTLTIGAGPTEQELQATEISLTNAQVAIFVGETETQNAVFMFETSTAEAFTDTPTTTPTTTPSATATEDLSGTSTAQFQATIAAANTNVAATETQAEVDFQLTLTTDPLLVTVPPEDTPILPTSDVIIDVDADADGDGVTDLQETSTAEAVASATASVDDTALTPDDTAPTATDDSITDVQATATAFAQVDADGTPIAQASSPTPDDTAPTATRALSSVQQTATAFALLFETPDATATPAGQDDGNGEAISPIRATPTPVTGIGGGDTALPDTGLFDDVFNGNPLMIFAAAFGLLGVIVISRGVRASNRKRRD